LAPLLKKEQGTGGAGIGLWPVIGGGLAVLVLGGGVVAYLAFAPPGPASGPRSQGASMAPSTGPVDGSTLRPGDTFRDCDVCPEMVVVPASTFAMGSPPGEEGRDSDEGPQRDVKFDRPFAVGKFEVTFAEWDACAAEGGCSYRPSDARWGRSKRPVINVSWNDITQQYLPWLSRKTGKAYRLLSEAEWEYVARAGTNSPFWWGTAISTGQANYYGAVTYGGGPKGENRAKSVPVDSFAANPWGLFNVHGNVWEWVQDCRNANYNGAPLDGAAWTTGDCSSRTLRGGSWDNNPGLLRSANRDRNTPDTRMDDVGFRVARTL
jgi:formylglycine-generating enzyme required for sulfatase activity